ncbi:MAG: nicotinate-nicotinamide nucleotide adenylyltransferase [Deltaproteobacteria bacterium]|nr:nicotinate-nicotinamide nucleotide adenylyltransferase [Deltaproteobacteria bacterium]
MATLAPAATIGPVRTIGVLGGTFDPPHAAHLLVATYVLAAAPVDAVWVLPVAHHPLGKQPGADFATRMHLCRLAFALLGERIAVRDDEQDSSGRTLDLLGLLRERHPQHQFRLIIGSDILAERARWHRFEAVTELAPPIVLRRPGFAVPNEFTDVALPVVLPELASTAIRERLRRGESAQGWLPQAVAAEIARLGLYRGGASHG